MQRTKAPFRADHVGSFLRPAALKEARATREKGAITAAELKAVEDREIEKIIKKQEEIGLKLATDGEFRRSWWHFDFLGMLDGVELYDTDQGIQFRGVQTKAQSLRIVSKVGFSNHPMLEHFKFLKAHTSVTPKMTIPAPPVLHFRLAKDGIKKSVYPDLDGFFHDLGQAYKQAVKGFYDAGCRYLQFDDTVWAYLCSQEELGKARERMSNVDQLQDIYARVINAALEGKPADMTITTHVCRGNFRSTWISEGGYEPVAETLLGKVNYDGYFLEYDTDRAGALEKKDDVKRRIDEAAKFAPPEQFCLSPQCGFASTEEGNLLAEEEQWAKLRMIKELADEVWK
jgi:5-methyltetrahydropteroyltriglutamate--homocysteine methyltransferase